MAKSTIILVGIHLAIVTIAALKTSPSSLHSQWTLFKRMHGKQYASPSEEAIRFEIFAKEWLEVERFNRYESEKFGFTKEVNQMSDWTNDELERIFGSKMTPPELIRRAKQVCGNGESSLPAGSKDDPLPDRVDWRDHGRVGPVKDQGECGSGWAFAVAGVLESLELPVKNITQVISLSAQNVMDCGTFSANPCASGNQFDSLGDVAILGGLQSDSDYPYLAAPGSSCKFNKSKSVVANKWYSLTSEPTEAALQFAVAKYGPVAASINVSDNFRNYKSGILSDNICSDFPPYANHVVLVVGYGTDPARGDYWIVKNSWGEAWGEKGYIRMARNYRDMCGIAESVAFATY